MDNVHKELTQIQELVLDIQKVKRNHRIPDTEDRENVVEHSFTISMLCWKLFNDLKPNLNLEKILKYSLIHDFSERGQDYDVNTYASQEERLKKKDMEIEEIRKISQEFQYFDEMISLMNDYNNLTDEESRFVWSIDKMQAMVLGGIDNWRPYELYGVTYEQFYKKGEEILSQCSPCLVDVFREVVTQSRKTYYDQPK